MTDQGTRREGWYADPLGQADLRWWDSRNWTTEVTSASAEGSRPNSAPRAPLQWAGDEAPPPLAAGAANRVSPPMPQPTADPKLALGAKSATAQTEPDDAIPNGPDWSELMRALLTAGDNIVTATAAGIPTITIDMAQRTYWWDLSLDSFPAHPVDLVVNAAPRGSASTPAVAGRYIEPLLWRVGVGAEALATRVDPSLRYKLRRWLDLASMPHTADQLHAIKVLANAQLTPTELGAIADIGETAARGLIGTFTLMALLDSVKDPAATR
ncbi:MAG: hypothetical protein QOD50_1754 [Actinomycetota bacterium]|nr:hypothetical protein [Actinomycetota bacterium]